MKKQFIVKSLLFGLAGLLDSIQVFAEGMNPYTFSFNSKQTGLWLMLILGIILLTAALILKMRVGQLSRSMKKKKHHPEERINELFQNIKKEDLELIIESRS